MLVIELSGADQMPVTYGAMAVDVLIDYIEHEGVEYIFGVPGAALTPIYRVLAERKRIKHILTKHEEGAAFMAKSYAWVSGGIGVCCATTGPGGTNALTGIASAYADSIPVLLLTGQSSTKFFGKGAFQESTSLGIDIVQLFKPVTKLSLMLPNSDRFPGILHHALRTALSGRPGPVHINLPADFLNEYVNAPQLSRHQYRARGAVMDRDAITRAAKIIAEAKRPAILVGHGASLSGGSSELLELATRLKIPVATTPKAKGIFPEDHPLSLGVFGFAGHAHAEIYLTVSNVDVLLVIGTSMGEWSTNAWASRLEPSGALIQVDIDPTVIGRNYPAEVGIVGDVRTVLPELEREVRRRISEGGGRDEHMWTDPLLALRSSLPRHQPAEPPNESTSPIKPQLLMSVLQAQMPEDALLFVDIGNAMSWAGHYFECRSPNSYFIGMGLAAMGSAVAGAIGGKLAAPGKPVVALVGDAAFAMNGMEVHTAVDHEIPVIWIVLNDGGHGMIMHGETLLLGQHLGACRFRVPIDIGALGAALGTRVFRVDTLQGFREAFDEALAANAPCVIDTLIDPNEEPSTLARRVKTLAASFDDVPLSIRQPVVRRR